ncbi:uncharacterized protein EI97DRAFT_463800 [Westerdykella ornata]|uniref:Uncharacterized protein n=1 Tax=Westerdykella ornata TaxID=318751 RepID=A0A6A6K0A7_WESOR|nr:uncharacterized protein EI97DRAFT_463800 [Westerdykella ornata]KAF2281476.1 hypothetical protein EI97DRAFT_463800 [Westerdykella ornata]
MTTRERKSSDLSSRLRRPLKASSQPSKALSSSTISTPPKAAIASVQAKKEDIHRRKNPFQRMLRQNESRSRSCDGPNGPDPDIFTSAMSRRHLQDGRDASTDAQVKGNDYPKTKERAADLVEALAAAKAEIDALKAELERARHYNPAYGDPATGDKTAVDAPWLPSKYPQPDIVSSPGRSLNGADASLLEQNYELRQQVTLLEKQLTEQDAMYRAKLDRHMHSRRAEWEELTARLHYAEKESRERLQQLRDLKQSISRLMKADSQITDGELVEGVDKLYHRIREWVVSNFRRSKLTYDQVPAEGAKVLDRIYPAYRQLKPSDRLPLYQSIVAHALREIFEENVVLGLPASGPLAPIRQLATCIQGAGSEFGDWRRATIRALEKSGMKHIVGEERAKMLHQLSADIERQLFALTSTQLTRNAKSELLAIVHSTADLQHALLLQKARYRLRFFSHDGNTQIFFDDRKMEPVNDVEDRPVEQGGMAIERTFGFCVFPCIEKFGNEFEETNHIRNVLLRARVWSAPTPD